MCASSAVTELLVHRLTLINCFTFVPAVFSRQMLHNSSKSQPLSACPECVGNEHAAGIHRPVFSQTSFQAQHDAMLRSLGKCIITFYMPMLFIGHNVFIQSCKHSTKYFAYKAKIMLSWPCKLRHSNILPNPLFFIFTSAVSRGQRPRSQHDVTMTKNLLNHQQLNCTLPDCVQIWHTPVNYESSGAAECLKSPSGQIQVRVLYNTIFSPHLNFAISLCKKFAAF